MSEAVLFFQTKTSTPSREKIAGAFRYLEDAHWNVQLIEANPRAGEILQSLRKWTPLGCIVDRGLAPGSTPVRLFGNLPTVYFDQNPATAEPDAWYVQHDSVATTRMAFRELRRHEPVHYAFVGDARATHWSRAREETLRRLAAECGVGFSCIGENEPLVDWLKTRPFPCGLMAASDFVARRVLDAANRAHVDMPKDLRIVGVDNDTFLCEHTRPTLSSVHPDFEGGGYLAMAILHRLVKGTSERPTTAFYGPRELVRRGSTCVFARHDARVSRAIDYISQHFRESTVSSETIAAVMGCSRRLADLRFREVTGHTIRDEIVARRIELARNLLADPRMDLSAIPSLCGYQSPTSFMRLFRTMTGETMSQFRFSRNT